MNWVELKAGNYEVRLGAKKVSECQLEIDCRSARVMPARPDWRLTLGLFVQLQEHHLACSRGRRRGYRPAAHPEL